MVEMSFDKLIMGMSGTYTRWHEGVGICPGWGGEEVVVTKRRGEIYWELAYSNGV